MGFDFHGVELLMAGGIQLLRIVRTGWKLCNKLHILVEKFTASMCAEVLKFHEPGIAGLQLNISTSSYQELEEILTL